MFNIAKIIKKTSDKTAGRFKYQLMLITSFQEVLRPLCFS